jgi:hypothetical protein
MGWNQREITPSDRRLQSAGPAKDQGPLPKRISTRTRKPKLTKVVPEPAPKVQALFGNVSGLGWSLLSGNRGTEAEPKVINQVNPAQATITPVEQDDPGDQKDDWSFF